MFDACSSRPLALPRETTIMKTASRSHPSAREIRAIIGPFEAEVLARILDLDPSLEDVQLAYKWLRSDEHLQGRVPIELSGKAGAVYEILDDEFPDFDASGHSDVHM
jgi:hypothetical protein